MWFYFELRCYSLHFQQIFLLSFAGQGAPDTFGKRFIIPVSNDAKNIFILVTTKTVNVSYTLTTLPGEDWMQNFLAANETVNMIEKSNINSTKPYDGVLLTYTFSTKF